MSRQVWSDSDYVYSVTSSGLEVFDTNSQLLGAVAYNIDGYSTVWANNNYIYLGSANAGLKRIYKPSISMNVVSPTNINSNLQNYFSYPDLRSNNIKYIHGNYNKLIICSTSGIDIVRTDSLYITHHTMPSGEVPLGCFVTETNNFYYTTVSGTTYYLHKLYGNNSDWINSDYFYTTTSGVLNGVASINDIYITDNTSVSGVNFNTLFLATDLGVYIIDEGSKDYIILHII